MPSSAQVYHREGQVLVNAEIGQVVVEYPNHEHAIC